MVLLLLDSLFFFFSFLFFSLLFFFFAFFSFLFLSLLFLYFPLFCFASSYWLPFSSCFIFRHSSQWITRLSRHQRKYSGDRKVYSCLTLYLWSIALSLPSFFSIQCYSLSFFSRSSSIVFLFDFCPSGPSSMLSKMILKEGPFASLWSSPSPLPSASPWPSPSPWLSFSPWPSPSPRDPLLPRDPLPPPWPSPCPLIPSCRISLASSIKNNNWKDNREYLKWNVNIYSYKTKQNKQNTFASPIPFLSPF